MDEKNEENCLHCKIMAVLTEHFDNHGEPDEKGDVCVASMVDALAECLGHLLALSSISRPQIREIMATFGVATGESYRSYLEMVNEESGMDNPQMHTPGNA